MADPSPNDERAAARREGEPETWDGKAVNELMSTPHGRRLVERFLDHCGAGGGLYRFDGDVLGMAWSDGLADAGRFWESVLLHHCPDLYLRMIDERRARLERDRKAIEKQEARRETPSEPLTVTGIEDLADEQARLAAEEEARQAREAKKPKRDKPAGQSKE